METKEYTTIDRKALGWPSGEWDGEPDKVQWQDAATGLPCLAVRNRRRGNWCGYVGVTEGHPFYEKDYENGASADVHGGITFGDFCQPTEDESIGICHVPAAGDPDRVWWLGFDCAHAWDYSPDDKKRADEEGGIWAISHDSHYRTLGYVKSECANLARQLKDHPNAKS